MNWITQYWILTIGLSIIVFPINGIIDVSKTIDHSWEAPGWEERTEWPADYPRPPKTEQSLFYIQRNLNTNTIVYDIDLKDGTIKSRHPIDAYWLRYGEEGARQDLSWLQAVLAYGYSSKQIEQGYQIKLKAYNDRYLQLEQIEGHWKAVMKINNIDCYLQNFYVYADESGIFPDVKYVDIYGYHPVTGALEVERILNQ